jgi:ADP-ribose pyrophosphatase YjhB (NUDIX family)
MINQMSILRSTIHPDVDTPNNNFQRIATRGIITQGADILLIFTSRYHDYSLPGGGVNQGEDIVSGLLREVEEETGAQNIHNVVPYGIYEELRPWYKSNFDAIHMVSYCFTCEADRQLGTPRLEENEIKNGVSALWINIHAAIEHNLEVIAGNPKAGLSIERETYLLQKIARELINK